MLSNVKNIFKVTDLRNKILFTFMIVAIYRIGAAIRVPGVKHGVIFDMPPHSRGTSHGALQPHGGDQHAPI